MNPVEPRLPDRRIFPPTRGAHWSTQRAASASSAHEDDRTLVRPYLVTGGRTRPVRDGLRVETLVHAAPAALHAPLKFEQRRIVELCQAPQSIAEIATAIGNPLGVARVLVADLIAANVITVHESADITIEMLERIIERVRVL
jgi:nucleoside-diphosphate-sugar epimerase